MKGKKKRTHLMILCCNYSFMSHPFYPEKMKQNLQEFTGKFPKESRNNCNVFTSNFKLHQIENYNLIYLS